MYVYVCVKFPLCMYVLEIIAFHGNPPIKVYRRDAWEGLGYITSYIRAEAELEC